MKSRFPLISFITGLLATGGLAALIYTQAPTSLLIVLALMLLLLAVWGLTAPVWILFFRKILSQERQQMLAGMGLRFGLWSGIFVTTLTVLQLIGFLERVFVLTTLAMLMLAEMFIQQKKAGQNKSSRKRKKR